MLDYLFTLVADIFPEALKTLMSKNAIVENNLWYVLRGLFPGKVSLVHPGRRPWAARLPPTQQSTIDYYKYYKLYYVL